MATSVDDPRITSAIHTAMAAMNDRIGTVGGNWCWDAIGLSSFRGSAWCGAFQVWAFKQAGVDLMRAAWWIYIPFVEAFARRIGAWVDEPGYGFQAIYGWGETGVADHIGASWPDPDSAFYRAIEGNTSMGGSQDNGNGVLVKYRSEDVIRGWVDMRIILAWMIDSGKWAPGSATSGTAAAPAPAVASVSALTGRTTSTDGQKELTVDGQPGPATIARLQQVMGTVIDGSLDEDGSPAIEALQRALNAAIPAASLRTLTGAPSLVVDGVAGPATWRAFQYWSAIHAADALKMLVGFDSISSPTHWAAWVDGVDGPNTWRMMQHCLNKSWAGSGKLLTR